MTKLKTAQFNCKMKADCIQNYKIKQKETCQIQT